MDRLTTQMQEASEKMEYEEAARYRDLLMSVKQVAQKQKRQQLWIYTYSKLYAAFKDKCECYM